MSSATSSDRIPIRAVRHEEQSIAEGRRRQGSSPMSLAESSESEGGNTLAQATSGSSRRTPVMVSRNNSPFSGRSIEKSRGETPSTLDLSLRLEASSPRLSDRAGNTRRNRSSESGQSSNSEPESPVKLRGENALALAQSRSGSGKTSSSGCFAVPAAKTGRSAYGGKTRALSIEDLRMAGDAKAIAKLLQRCEPKWAANPEYAAILLEIAACRGSKDLIDWLVRQGVDFLEINEEYIEQNKVSPLLTAAMFGHPNTAKALAKQGLRCSLSEMANSSPKVLKILLATSADVLNESKFSRISVVDELVARKNKLAERPLEAHAPFFDSRRNLETTAEQQAVDSFYLLSKAGAIVSSEAMIAAIQGGQTQLAWAMLHSYQLAMQPDTVWNQPGDAWAVIWVAISLGQKEPIARLLLAKKDDSWNAPSASEALSLAEALVADDRHANIKHVIFPAPNNSNLVGKFSRRDEILQMLVNDKRLADHNYRLKRARASDYLPQYNRGRHSQK